MKVDASSSRAKKNDNNGVAGGRGEERESGEGDASGEQVQR